jgi:hypothetical protein
VAQAFDLDADVGLSVKLGPRHTGHLGDGREDDKGAVVVKRSQRLNSFGAGELAPLPCSGDDVVALSAREQ